ncbi:unnamed protein product [Paramecium pentaurelia]|uniref:H-type lectin domain-containing protein n=1 Tax=Paramecium pentaurelia TaxID=43138 RepID=A0A8S1XNB2_9CILI|nr:unnamed protein product [Paramecium pentaurelia]
MILFTFYFISAYAQITSDSGFYAGFTSSSDFICKDGFQTTATLSFNGQFSNTPQVFLGLELLDFDRGIDYRLSITAITTSNFDVSINCITSIQVFAVQFSWYAIDDQRIQVINNFNMDNPDIQTFNNINPNANQGIISITSLGIQGDIDFSLSISSITPTNVQVSITKVTGKFENLKQLGYQIILGTQEAFFETKTNSFTNPFNSGTLIQQMNRWLFLSFTGFSMNSFLKEKVIRVSLPLSYTLETFDVPFVKCNHLISWIAYQFTTIYKAFECQSVRLSQSNDNQVSTKPSIQIDIQELKIQLVSSYQQLIDKQMNSLNLNVYVKCQNTKKIVSQFLRCQDCAKNKYHKFSNYCNQQIDIVTYFLRYQSAQSFSKELSININSDGITITQVLYNQVKTIEKILEIQIQNQ